MDSKTINKLIRSEVWPILKKQGFSGFDSRSAFAYNPPFVNVVSFQSFNSYLAGGAGCTTYSFTPRLGVYVIGTPGEDRIKRDKAGRLRPFEYQCSFRSELRKRTPVDGFARDDIFYIDPEGTTTSPCFEELKYLCTAYVPNWFSGNNDLEGILSRMELAEGPRSIPVSDVAGRPGSYSLNLLRSALLLVKHQKSPSDQSAGEAFEALNQVMGNVLDFPATYSGEEGHALDMRELWEKLADFRPSDVVSADSIAIHGSLDGPIWPADPKCRQSAVDSTNCVPPRKQLWPILKSAGFSEFTDRLAHRVSSHLVEVVEILPTNPAAGLFRIGLGVYWPALEEHASLRRNKLRDPRPTAKECHVSNWLVPEAVVCKQARTAFDSIEEALGALTVSGLGWFATFRDSEQALALLQRKDWELFWRCPMMRGLGAAQSSRRLVYIGYLKHLLGKIAESQQYIQRAEEALHRYPEHHHNKNEVWISQVKARIQSPSSGAPLSNPICDNR